MTNKLEEVLKELQESHVLVEKVKVPKFIADWIEDHKAQYSIWDSDSKGEFIIRCSVDLYRYDEGLSLWDYKITDKVSDWIDENKFGFISSVLFGYETEEEKAKFEVGEYYTIGLGISSREIFMVISAEDKLKAKSYRVSYDHFRIMSTALKGNSFVVTDSKLATDEEIKLFKRAEMYHKHGRKLDELKIGDLLMYNRSEIFRLDKKSKVEFWITDITTNEEAEIYLTVEEQKEAYKKIVGE